MHMCRHSGSHPVDVWQGMGGPMYRADVCHLAVLAGVALFGGACSGLGASAGGPVLFLDVGSPGSTQWLCFP